MMSCTLSHECRVMLSSLLTASNDATRVWLRAEMDRTVDPMLHSIFNRLTTKLTNALGRAQSTGDCAQLGNQNTCFHDKSANVQIHQPSQSHLNLQQSTSSFNPTSSHFNPQFVNMNYSYQQQNGPNHLDSISNQQSSSQSQPVTVKEEIEPMATEHIQSCSYAPVSDDQSNHNLTDQHLNNNVECGNSQINLPDTETQPQPQLFAHIKHNQFDDEECDCDECVDGGIEVKEEDDDADQVDDLSRLVKRPRLVDISQPNKSQPKVTRQFLKQPTDEAQLNEDGHDEGEQSKAIDTRNPTEQFDHGQTNSDESMVIQQEERDANNAIGEEITNECTTNPVQPNLAQPNRHLQCPQCHKSFNTNFKLQQHLRMHTGERSFQCDLCEKRFKEKGNLTQHQLIHQNIKRFRCHECDKQFTHKQHLLSHLRIHSGDRPFECRHCDKSFADLGTRNKHEQAIHLHVKPYRCKQCGLPATQRTTIITHIRVVHFGLPKSIKQQRALNIIDERDPRELIEKV